MNLPNKLTVARVIAVPFFILAFMTNHFLIAFVIFILASLTDMLDGKIARKYNLVTNFGKIMDPLADKILVYSAFCLLITTGAVPAWMLIIILAREFTISGMRMVAAAEGIVIAAGLTGKIKTVFLGTHAVTLLICSRQIIQCLHYKTMQESLFRGSESAKRRLGSKLDDNTKEKCSFFLCSV